MNKMSAKMEQAKARAGGNAIFAGYQENEDYRRRKQPRKSEFVGKVHWLKHFRIFCRGARIYNTECLLICYVDIMPEMVKYFKNGVENHGLP